MAMEDRLRNEGLDQNEPTRKLRVTCGDSATVPEFLEDAEAPMLGQHQWEAVHARHAQSQSVSAIARELDFDRKTVRTCLRQTPWEPYQRVASRSLA
jgi:hypothetical protein